jgi:hypothetical protein
MAMIEYGKTSIERLGELQRRFKDVVRARLDVFVHTRDYDDIVAACSYTTSLDPQNAAEAAYCIQARDATWAKAYDLMSGYTVDDFPALTDLEAQLPPLQWPTE